MLEKVVDKLVDECAETVEVKLAKITLANKEYKYKCSSSTFHSVIFDTLYN